MLPTTSTISSQVSNPALEFVHYFPRQLITADDMRAEQAYFREKLRRHNRMLHGWGIVCGCGVSDLKNGWHVKVGKGYVITPAGDEICIPDDITFDLASDVPKAFDPCSHPSPCSPAGGVKPAAGKTVYLAVCYTECNTRPVRTHPAGCGCGCDDSACEYSRVRESYELVCLDIDELPESYKIAKSAKKPIASAGAGKDPAIPIPACPPQIDDCCVVLASITLPDSQGKSIETIDDLRRPCLITSALDLLIQAKVKP